MIDDLVAKLNPEQTTALLIVGTALSAATIIAVIAILAGWGTRASTIRARARLTRQMIDRGMTPDQISQVLGMQRHDLPGDSTPLALASEAVVRDDDDDWRAALVLQVAQGRYFVHYVGRDMDENEWVGEDRVRFPAGSGLPDLTASTIRAHPVRNGTPVKPPAELEV